MALADNNFSEFEFASSIMPKDNIKNLENKND